MDYYYFLNSLCLNYKSFTKKIEKQTHNSLVYGFSCLTATTKDDQVLKILTLLASALSKPPHQYYNGDKSVGIK